MHEKVLPQGSKQLLSRLEREESKALQGWILAGGTGLALSLGHRVSIDFDFFRLDEFNHNELCALFSRIGDFEILQEAENTLTMMIDRVKLSFFTISDPFIYATTPFSFFAIADVHDIALMKLIAVSGRGSRKDFVDLYTIMRVGESLQYYFDLLDKKYRQGRANAYHILKSLTYFDDAEKEPLPQMLEPFNWRECKNFFLRNAHMIILPG